MKLKDLEKIGVVKLQAMRGTFSTDYGEGFNAGIVEALNTEVDLTKLLDEKKIAIEIANAEEVRKNKVRLENILDIVPKYAFDVYMNYARVLVSKVNTLIKKAP